MSRAFVKEQDDAPEELLERPISPNPNFVTERGLQLIDEAIDALRHDQARAHSAGDKAAVARAARDLRYWLLRRASAQLVAPPQERMKVAFATRVTLRRSDGRLQHFTIVGEDQADPAQGYIAYNAPLARAVLGKLAGDVAEAPGGEVEIVAVE